MTDVRDILAARVVETTNATGTAAARCRTLRASLRQAEDEFDSVMDDAMDARSALATFHKTQEA